MSFPFLGLKTQAKKLSMNLTKKLSKNLSAILNGLLLLICAPTVYGADPLLKDISLGLNPQPCRKLLSDPNFVSLESNSLKSEQAALLNTKDVEVLDKVSRKNGFPGPTDLSFIGTPWLSDETVSTSIKRLEQLRELVSKLVTLEQVNKVPNDFFELVSDRRKSDQKVFSNLGQSSIYNTWWLRVDPEKLNTKILRWDFPLSDCEDRQKAWAKLATAENSTTTEFKTNWDAQVKPLETCIADVAKWAETQKSSLAKYKETDPETTAIRNRIESRLATAKAGLVLWHCLSGKKNQEQVKTCFSQNSSVLAEAVSKEREPEQVYSHWTSALRAVRLDATVKSIPSQYPPMRESLLSCIEAQITRITKKIAAGATPSMGSGPAPSKEQSGAEK